MRLLSKVCFQAPRRSRASSAKFLTDDESVLFMVGPWARTTYAMKISRSSETLRIRESMFNMMFNMFDLASVPAQASMRVLSLCQILFYMSFSVCSEASADL